MNTLDELRDHLQESARKQGFQYLSHGGVILVKPTMDEIDAARIRANEALEKYRAAMDGIGTHQCSIEQRMQAQTAWYAYQAALAAVDSLLREYHKEE